MENIDKKVYGYILVDKETGEEWGNTIFYTKCAAACGYNNVNNRSWRDAERHTFNQQNKWEVKVLVVQDE